MNAFTSLVRNIIGAGHASSLGHNFRTCGATFGTLDYDEFEALARKFYQDAMHSEDTAYTVVKMTGGRSAIDFNGEVRGVYDKYGNPLAFFRPSYRGQGFKNKEEELSQFRNGAKIAF